MDIIEKFIRKNCWKFPKGYPDLNDPSDRKLFNKLLLEIGFPTLEGEISENSPAYNAFSFGDMTKTGRAGRATTIADKIQKGDSFAMVDGTNKELDFAKPEYEELFKNQQLEKIKQLGGSRVNKFAFFIDSEDNYYGLDSLLKDKDLGGQGKGAGTKAEDAALGNFKALVEKLVQDNGGPITVTVNGEKYPNIVTVQTQPKFPKADFNMIDNQGNAVVFISHKKASYKGASPDDFMRWGGFVEYKDHPEVKLFTEKLVEFLQKNNLTQIPPATKFIKEIVDNTLAQKLVYGKDYGSEKFGINNITIAIQGDVKLEKQDDGSYNLTGEHYYYNGDIPTGDYRPVLTGSYRSDRKMFGIPGLEAIAQPAGLAHKATNKYELKSEKTPEGEESKNQEFVKLLPKKKDNDSKNNN